MKCSKHARDMKWVGSLTKGGLVCEDCQFADESNAYKDDNVKQAIDPVAPTGAIVGAPLLPHPPPSAPVPARLPISRMELFQNYLPIFAEGIINTLPINLINSDPILQARYRAGFYHALLVNTNPRVTVRCPYCNRDSSGQNMHCKSVGACGQRYHEDQTNGLVIP